MRAVTLFASILLSTGCTSDDTDAATTPTSSGTEWTTLPPEVIDTGWPAGDLGNLMMSHHVNSGITRLYGVFTQSSPGFVNLGECAIDGTPCLTAFPNDEDAYEDIDPDLELDRTTVRTRYLGYEIEYAGHVLPYHEDADTGFGFYYKDISSEELPAGWVGSEWGGQWEDWKNNDDLYVSDPIELIFPRVDGHIQFHNGEFVPFEWVPTGEGIITLSVSSKFGISRLYVLEDDGYYELDADDLGFTSDSEELTFKFTRWNINEARRFGHIINYVATTDAYFTGDYFNIGARDYLYAADRCGEAAGLPSLQGGGWWGRLGDFGNDLQASSQCLNGGAANGNDAIHRVDVDPRYALSVDYNVVDESASVYILTDCTDDSDNSCITGADVDPYENVHEYVNYFNSTDDPRTVYLVMDSTAVSSSVYTLDVTLDPLFPPDVYDTCAEAQAAAYPLGSASYYADFTAYADDLNPGSGGCTASSTPGADSLAPVEIGAGQTLSVTINMPAGDPALYLLYNCADEFTCPLGADLSLGPSEQLAYTNTGGSTETVYLVIDSKTGLSPYFMNVSVF